MCKSFYLLTSPLQQFWAPVLSGASPALVCAAYVPVWGLDRDPSAPPSARVEDFVPLNDQFVGGGDLRLAAGGLGEERRPAAPRADAEADAAIKFVV